jgi:protein TIF31
MFHSHGVNIRYIGEVYKQIKDKELNHLKVLLEREAVFRAAKHLINEYIRDCPDTYLASVMSHLLNMLLAPQPMIQKMDDGTITYKDVTIQSLV